MDMETAVEMVKLIFPGSTVIDVTVEPIPAEAGDE